MLPFNQRCLESKYQSIPLQVFYQTLVNNTIYFSSLFRQLDLSFNRIKKIENLEAITKVKKLFFVQNKITKIENISHMTELTMLELGANRIRVSYILDDQTQVDSKPAGQPEQASLNQCQLKATINSPKISALCIHSWWWR